MCDARRISARGVSLGVQRHVLDRVIVGGRTVTAHEGAVPRIFGRLAIPRGGGPHHPRPTGHALLALARRRNHEGRLALQAAKNCGSADPVSQRINLDDVRRARLEAEAAGTHARPPRSTYQDRKTASCPHPARFASNWPVTPRT